MECSSKPLYTDDYSGDMIMLRIHKCSVLFILCLVHWTCAGKHRGINMKGKINDMWLRQGLGMLSASCRSLANCFLSKNTVWKLCHWKISLKVCSLFPQEVSSLKLAFFFKPGLLRNIPFHFLTFNFAYFSLPLNHMQEPSWLQVVLVLFINSCHH